MKRCHMGGWGMGGVNQTLRDDNTFRGSGYNIFWGCQLGIAWFIFTSTNVIIIFLWQSIDFSTECEFIWKVKCWIFICKYLVFWDENLNNQIYSNIRPLLKTNFDRIRIWIYSNSQISNICIRISNIQRQIFEYPNIFEYLPYTDWKVT